MVEVEGPGGCVAKSPQELINFAIENYFSSAIFGHPYFPAVVSCALIVVFIYTLLYREAKQLSDHSIAKRQSISPPAIPCNSSNEGASLYKAVHADMIWICKSKEWTPYRVSPSIGATKSLSAGSCNEIKQALCNVSNGVYWVKGSKVYCDMTELDGGGWTLVWQHSYIEDLPLNLSMRYFSEHYTPCVTRASGWCNIPNKARFNPTEQMIVAYHKGTVVYAYKGLFNRNIDYNWSGAILLDFKKIVDKCIHANGVQPAPENRYTIGLTFDKSSPYNYEGANCDTYTGSFTSPTDCRWVDCQLPSSISKNYFLVQMTVAIYVR